MAADHECAGALRDWAWQMLMPEEAGKRKLCQDGRVLVHHTSPANAKNILKSRELWLSNARQMDDQAEIHFGRDCVECFLEERAAEFAGALDAINPRIWETVWTCWRGEYEAQINQTYIACFLETFDGDVWGSERHWDNYGSVAFHLDPAFLREEPSNLCLYLVKVTYGLENVQNELLSLLTHLRQFREELTQIPSDVLASFIRHKLFFTSVATKANEFSWEVEWRIIYTPYLFSSAHVTEGKSINRKSFQILELRNTIDGSSPLLGIPKLIRNVVIRPTGGPEDRELRLDLIAQLTYHGVPDAAARVRLQGNKAR